MKNTILFDCERLKYPNTGLYTFCESLGNALLKNATSNEQITAYIPAKAINIFGSNARYLIQRPWHKMFIPQASEFNLWHSSYQSSKYYPSNNNTKILLTIHDLNFLVEKQQRPDKISKLLSKIQEKIDKATAIVCISNFVASQVRQHCDLGNKTITVIYNGCTVNDYPDFKNPSYEPMKPFLFTIGTILPKKNFHVLPALLQQNDYELVIAGNLSSQTYIESILSEAEKYKVSERVKIIGSISNQERSWYYRNCKAFVFPSIAEGFGLPVIEAMHYGKPVFLSTHTSLPEIGADAAYYFEDFEAENMQQTLQNGLIDFTINNMTEKAKKRAAVFNWNNTAKSYLKIYKAMS